MFIFVAEADEESTSRGIIELIDKALGEDRVRVASTEGGGILEENGKVKFVGVADLREGPALALLASKGVSGHGCRPRPDNPSSTSPPRSRR